jgi:NADPH:quinone reductase
MATPSTIPRTMRGVLVESAGGTEVLQFKTELPVPEPKEGEILVKNEYIGVNYIDMYVQDVLNKEF